MYNYIEYTHFYEELVEAKNMQEFVMNHPNEQIPLWEKKFFDGSYIQLSLHTETSLFQVKTESMEETFPSLLDAYEFFVSYCNLNHFSRIS